MAGRGRSRAKSSVVEVSERSNTVRKPRPGRSKQHYNPINIFSVNLKVMTVIGFCSMLVVVLAVYFIIISPEEHSPLPRVITPFPSPKLMDLPMFHGEHKESLYWGTYRPHTYFGIRARTPRSLLAGLMWIGIKDGMYAMRHFCENSDGLRKFGWTLHNGRDFGHQLLVDQGLTLKTSFLKLKSIGSAYGGDWAVQIDVEDNLSQSNEKMRHLFFYLVEEDLKANMKFESVDLRKISVLASGSRRDVGGWQLHLNSMDPLEVHYAGFRTVHIHNLSTLVEHNLGAQARILNKLELSDTQENNANAFVFQISGKIPFRVDLSFLTGTNSRNSRVDDRLRDLSGASLSTKLQEKKREFDAKFERCFNLTEKLTDDAVEVGKAAIANLLGGMGYFFGQSKISSPDTSNEKNPENFVTYWPAELYTAVPSRAFFPRGFLWDEGFHQMLIWRWDFRITLDAIGHWLDMMNIDGWIPREQILGSEALSKVPEEFVAQHATNANPPTLFLVVRDLLDAMDGDKFTLSEANDVKIFLERGYIRLKSWFQWFNTTQSGKEPSSYFWHGRDSKTDRELNPKTLSSGLDDYPRASHPNGEERHLDLRCWILLAATCMHSISHSIKAEAHEVADFLSTAELLADFDLLNKLHFDPTYGTYFDYGNHAEKVSLRWKESNTAAGYTTRQLVRDVLVTPEPMLVPHFGYVSLFPFMMKVIPTDSWILGKQLDFISNRSVLWTDYGLRSLAKTSSLYMKRNTEHDAPYWRGPIWMNINYMILSSLRHYSKGGPYSERADQIYHDLRNNLIRNVVSNYQETGFLWEQYDQKKGKGKGARLFTGWTSLIVLIMAEVYA